MQSGQGDNASLDPEGGTKSDQSEIAIYNNRPFGQPGVGRSRREKRRWRRRSGCGRSHGLQARRHCRGARGSLSYPGHPDERLRRKQIHLHKLSWSRSQYLLSKRHDHGDWLRWSHRKPTLKRPLEHLCTYERTFPRLPRKLRLVGKPEVIRAANVVSNHSNQVRCPIYQGALTVKMRSLPRARSTHSRSRPR